MSSRRVNPRTENAAAATALETMTWLPSTEHAAQLEVVEEMPFGWFASPEKPTPAGIQAEILAAIEAAGVLSDLPFKYRWLLKACREYQQAHERRRAEVAAIMLAILDFIVLIAATRLGLEPNSLIALTATFIGALALYRLAVAEPIDSWLFDHRPKLVNQLIAAAAELDLNLDYDAAVALATVVKTRSAHLYPPKNWREKRKRRSVSPVPPLAREVIR